MVLWCCKGGGEGLNSVVGLRGIVGMLCGSELRVLGGAVIISITDLSPLSEEACLKKKSFLRR